MVFQTEPGSSLVRPTTIWQDVITSGWTNW